MDLKQIAQTTAGFTGADLENLLNEAAIIAAKENRVFIGQEDIKKAFVKVGIGAEKKSRIISDKEKKITAYHESGHAILFHVLPDVGPVLYGFHHPHRDGGPQATPWPLPERDDMFMTKGRMLQEIMVSWAGGSRRRLSSTISRRRVQRYQAGYPDRQKDGDEVRHVERTWGLSATMMTTTKCSIGRDLAHGQGAQRAGQRGKSTGRSKISSTAVMRKRRT